MIIVDCYHLNVRDSSDCFVNVHLLYYYNFMHLLEVAQLNKVTAT